MTPVKRSGWKCHICQEQLKQQNLQKNKIGPDAPQETEEENTTQPTKQKINVPTENSFGSLDIDDDPDEMYSSSILGNNTLNRSCPILGNNLKEELDTLTTINQTLEDNLQKAENEIENLVTENGSLQKQIEEMKKNIEVLTQICKSTDHQTKSNIIKNRRISWSVSKTHTNFTNSPQLTPIKMTHPRLGIWSPLSFSENCGKVAEIENSKTDLLKKCENYQEEILELERQIYDLEKKLSDLPSIEPDTEEKCIETIKRKPMIYIIGGQQCTGLAVELISTKSNTKFKEYQVTSITKPFASTEEILKSCSTLEATSDDYVILNIGETDHNPTQIVYNLSAAVKTLEKSNIIILSVVKNNFLNENKLNDTLKTLCNEINHCKFIDFSSKFKTNRHNLRQTCKTINFYIDYVEYETKFLMYTKRAPKLGTDIDKNSNAYVQQEKSMSKSHMYKKGTIPYYFQKIRERTAQLDIRKKTLLDYFPVVVKNRERDNDVEGFFRI